MDSDTVLHETLELLSTFFASNPVVKFAELLDRLEQEIQVFRKDIRQKQRRRLNDKRIAQVRTSPEVSSARQEVFSAPKEVSSASQRLSNVVTRSRAERPREKAVLTVRSHLNSEEALGANGERSPSHSSSSNLSSPRGTAVAPQISSSNPQLQAQPAFVRPSEDYEVKLEGKIQTCKDSFHGRRFIVTVDGHTETVNSDEVDDFFSRFQKDRWLSTFNLMPLIFSFPWPSTTLLLHSSYVPLSETSKNRPTQVQKKRWPIMSSHDRVILPCCLDEHWTLIEVDLGRQVIRQYNSLTAEISESAQLISLVEERLKDSVEGHSDVSFTRENGVRLIFPLIVSSMADGSQLSQKQSNGADCGVFMAYNAECLALDRDTMEGVVTGVELRYRFLERLLHLERHGESERQIMDMVLGSGKKIRIKRRIIPPEISSTEPDQEEAEYKKTRLTNWAPPSHLGPEGSWLEERDRLAWAMRENGSSRPERFKRAEELLGMVEAIGCHEVMVAWEETISQSKALFRPQFQANDSTAKAIYHLTERTEVRTFMGKAMVRIGKWMFAIKILQDVEKLRQNGPPSKQSGNAETAPGGNAVTRAMTSFMNEVDRSLSHPSRAHAREQEYRKYKKWWDEGQIWIALCNVMGVRILLLIPGDPCATSACPVSNKHFVRMRSGEREPFIEALRKLRPDLETLEIGNQLEVLTNDIESLMGRSQSAKPKPPHFDDLVHQRRTVGGEGHLRKRPLLSAVY